MKNLLLLLACLAHFTYSDAQVWQQVADYPIICVDATSFVIDGVGYVGTVDEDNNDVFYRYDEGQDSWSLISQPSAPELNGRRGGTAFALGGKGYILGGQRAIGVENKLDVWAYDPGTDTWEQKADFPGDEFFLENLVSFVIGGKAYVKLGGVNDFYEYDPAIDTWTAKASFPGIATSEHVAFAVDGKGYIGLGSGNDGFSESFYSYDPASDAWTSIADFAGGPRVASLAFVLKGRAYAGFGFGEDGSYFDDIYQYDPMSNTWISAGSSGYLVQDAVAFSTDSYAYVGTGNMLFDIFDDFWRFSPLTNTTSDIKGGQTFEIYPNPSKDWLQVKVENPNTSVQQIVIFDQLGQRVKTVTGGVRVPIHDLPEGPYWLSVQFDDGNATQSFVKN